MKNKWFSLYVWTFSNVYTSSWTSFFINVSIALGVKGVKSLPLSVLCTFYRQRVLVVLQQVQVISILKCVVAIGKGSSNLGILTRGSPFPCLICFLLQEGVSETWCSFCGLLLWWFFCLFGHGSFHFVLCIPFFLGALIYLWLVGFHQQASTVINLLWDLFSWWGLWITRYHSKMMALPYI